MKKSILKSASQNSLNKLGSSSKFVAPFKWLYKIYFLYKGEQFYIHIYNHKGTIVQQTMFITKLSL